MNAILLDPTPASMVRKKPANISLQAFFALFVLPIGGGGGIRTHVQKPSARGSTCLFRLNST